MMIKHLRIASDLHLEGFNGRDPEILALDFLPKDYRDAESILILAGDISSAPDQLVGFIRACQVRFPKVLFIPGNHEFYKHDYIAWNAEMTERFEMYCPGLVFALGTVGTLHIEELNLRFAFGTLWGDGGPTFADQGQVGFYLNDFRLISNGFHPEHGTRLKFAVTDMMSIHKAQKEQVREFLNEPFDGKTVVVTHHLPSRRLVSTRFWPKDGSDGANGGFVGYCDDLLAADSAPNLWIHGHTHDTIDTTLWKCRIVCNPAGYRGEWSSPFNTFMTTELREDGSKRAVTVPKFVSIEEL